MDVFVPAIMCHESVHVGKASSAAKIVLRKEAAYLTSKSLLFVCLKYTSFYMHGTFFRLSRSVLMGEPVFSLR